MNFLKKVILTVVTLSIVASLSLTLTGCPPAAPTEEATEVEETTKEEEEVEEVEEKESTEKTIEIEKNLEGKSIGAAFLTTANDYTRIELEAIRIKIEEQGGNLIVADAMGDWQTHSNNVENFIEQGVNGIIIQPGAAPLVQPLAEKAYDKGIFVVTTNMEFCSEKISTAVIPNHFLMGVEIASQMIRNMDITYQGEVYVLLPTGIFDFEERYNGIESVLSNFTGIEIKRMNIPEDPTSVISETMNKMQSLIQADSDNKIKAIYGTADFFAIGPYQAVLDSGREDIKVYGSDGDPIALKAILSDEGIWMATSLRIPSQDGLIAAENLIKAIIGEETPLIAESLFYTVTDWDIVQRVESLYGKDYLEEVLEKE